MGPTRPPDPVHICDNRFLELYTCKKCLFKTDLYVFYNKHVQTVHQKRKLNFDYQLRKHVCQKCRYTSHSLLQWFGHRCNKWHKCTKCAFKTKNVNFLSNHWQTVHEVKDVFECDQCTFISSRPEYLEIHRRTIHQAQKWYTCLECPFGSLDPCFLKVHVRKEHKIQWKKISVDESVKCDRIRRSYKDLIDDHVKRRNSYPCSNPYLELYTCKKCPFTSEFYVYYRQHVQLVHRNCKLNFEYQPKRHVCKRCKFETHSWLHWFQHQQRPCRTIGTTVTNILLEGKSRVFKSQDEKTIHKANGVFKCDKCSFISSRPEYLKIHNQTKHQAQKWYTCLVCPFGSLDQSSVRLHVRREHKMEWQWKEISADESVPHDHVNGDIIKGSSKKLIRRAAATTGYNCKHCTFTTEYKYCLLTHVNLNHVKCPFCDWRSSQRHRLNEHILDKHHCYSCSNRHLKLYTCKKCSFNTKFYVYYHRHVQLVHRKCKLPFNYQPKKHVCNRCKFVTHSWLHWLKHQQRPCRKIGTTVTNIVLEERSRIFKLQAEKKCGKQRKCFRQVHQMSIQSVI